MSSRTPSRLALLLMIILQSWRWLIPRKKPKDPKTIWIVHQLLLGDTIMLTGLLAKIRANYPHAKIIMIANPNFATLYQKKLYQYPFDKGQCNQEQRHQNQAYNVQYWGYNPRNFCSFVRLFLLPKPDWALVPGDNRYGWLAFVRGAKWTIGFTGDRPAYKQWCFNELLALPKQATAVTDMMQQLCTGKEAPPYQPKQWKIYNHQRLPAYSYRNDQAPNIIDLESPSTENEYTNNKILFHLGAKSATKHWSTENWLALADYFKQQNKQVILSAGKGETAQLDEIQKISNLPSYRANLSLLQLIEIMQNVELIVCLDNGIGQLAKVIATPTVCLFGAGSTTLFAEAKFWQDIPYRSVTTAMECRDTHLLFKREIDWVQTCNRSIQDCVHQKPICMQNIAVKQVIDACEKFQH